MIENIIEYIFIIWYPLSLYPIWTLVDNSGTPLSVQCPHGLWMPPLTIIFKNVFYINNSLSFFCFQKHLKIFRFNCHLCHREGIRMGFATKKRLYRHMAFAHNVDPALEDNEANRDLILNPPPLGIVSEKMSKLTIFGL